MSDSIPRLITVKWEDLPEPRHPIIGYADRHVRWKDLFPIVPELRDLRRRVRKLQAFAGPGFCANGLWYGYDGSHGIKGELSLLVGWEAASDHELARSPEAYDFVYDALYDSLPDCDHDEDECWLDEGIVSFWSGLEHFATVPEVRREWQRMAPQVSPFIFFYWGRQCAMCGSTSDLTVDHIVPISKGGTNDPSNLRPLCRSCNSRKGAH